MTEETAKSDNTDKNRIRCGMACVKCETINKGKCYVKENGIDNNYETALTEDFNCKLGASSHQLKTINSFCRRPACQMVWGVFLILISVLGFIFPPTELIILEKSHMRRGLPILGWWMDPPDVLKVKVYIFNVTNHERFLSGADAKINVQELGPVVYVETIRHFNVTYNPDDTLTYFSKRTMKLLPEDSKYSVNDTLIVPNGAILGVASMLHDKFFLRTGFKMLLNIHAKKFFIKKTIHEYLWDYTDAILESSRVITPTLVPATNMGLLNQTMDRLKNEVTVKIGPRWGHHDFFRIQKYEDVPELTGYDANRCLNNITDASDGVLYHHYISKKDVMFFFQKAMCTLVPLQFDEETVVSGMTAYKFNLSNTVYNRVPKNVTNCHEDSTLPSGIKDVSKCYYNYPIVLSNPHFCFADIPKDAYVTGLAPDPNKHSTGSIHIEPITGTQLRVTFKTQANLRINKIKGLYSKDFDKFSDIVIPVLWIDTTQDEMPMKILVLLYVVVVILPVLSPILFSIAIITGLVLIYKNLCKNKLKKNSIISMFRRKKLDIVKNRVMTYEQELFLKKSPSDY